MIIQIRKGELRISTKVFYLLILVLGATVLIALQAFLDLRAKFAQRCAAVPPDRSSSLTKERHKACSKDPMVYNTPTSCPKCFRPNAYVMSSNLVQIPRDLARLPRGPPVFFKPGAKKLQEFIKGVLVEPTSICVEDCPYIVAMQMSVTDKTEQRNTIRSTWASVSKTKIWPHANLNADMEVIFVLAHQSSMSTLGASKVDAVARNITKEEWQLVKAEADRYGDVLYLDMIDSYYNLTLKVISALKWARDHCPRTKFFLKVDADTFVNVPLMVDLLIYNQAQLEFSVTGFIYVAGRVYRDGRWAITKDLYPVNIFPLYASGCAYIISNKGLTRILQLFPYIPLMVNEDAYITGILGRAAQLNHFTDSSYSIFTRHAHDLWSWCELLNETLVTATGVTHDFKMRLVWSGVMLNDWICQAYNFIQMYCRCWEEFPAQ